jgi:hypothetical protein
VKVKVNPRTDRAPRPGAATDFESFFPGEPNVTKSTTPTPDAIARTEECVAALAEAAEAAQHAALLLSQRIDYKRSRPMAAGERNEVQLLSLDLDFAYGLLGAVQKVQHHVRTFRMPA